MLFILRTVRNVEFVHWAERFPNLSNVRSIIPKRMEKEGEMLKSNSILAINHTLIRIILSVALVNSGIEKVFHCAEFDEKIPRKDVLREMSTQMQIQWYQSIWMFQRVHEIGCTANLEPSYRWTVPWICTEEYERLCSIVDIPNVNVVPIHFYLLLGGLLVSNQIPITADRRRIRYGRKIIPCWLACHWYFITRLKVFFSCWNKVFITN